MAPALALEIAANGLATLSVALAARNSVQTWWVGILGCVLFTGLFLDAKLYADATLQVFFVGSSLWGWRHWHRGDAAPGAQRVARTSWPRLAALVCAAVMLTSGYGALLHRHTDAYAPFVDSAALAFSLAAQLLLMQRRVETWPAWLIVNTISVPLFASRGLYLTAVLYAAYWVNAWYGWWRWHREAVPVRAA